MSLLLLLNPSVQPQQQTIIGSLLLAGPTGYNPVIQQAASIITSISTKIIIPIITAVNNQGLLLLGIGS